MKLWKLALPSAVLLLGVALLYLVLSPTGAARPSAPPRYDILEYGRARFSGQA